MIPPEHLAEVARYDAQKEPGLAQPVPEGAPAMPLVFSSDLLAPEAREAAWRSVVRDAFGGLRVVDASPRFSATLAVRPLGVGARIVRLTGSPQRVRRDARNDALATTWNLLVQERGTCHVRHRGEGFSLAEGAFAAIDGRHGFELELPRGFDQWLLQLPRDMVLARAPHLEFHTPGTSTDGPGDRWLRTVVVETARAAEWLEGDAQLSLVDVLCAALALGESFKPKADGGSATFARARLLLERFAHDAAFGPAALADGLRASRRHVEKVFAAQGTSVAQELWRIRLERCARDLAAPAHRHRTIFDIARSNGFTSAAHFARAFRQRFGLTATAYRQRHRRG